MYLTNTTRNLFHEGSLQCTSDCDFRRLISGSFISNNMSQTKPTGHNGITGEKGIFIFNFFMKLNIFIPGIQAIVSIVCVSFFLIQSFMLIGDYFKEETFVTPSKKRLEDMPSPTISFCDKYYADRLYINEDVATLAGNYSSDYQHNESNILNSFPKERTYLYYFFAFLS